MSIVTSTTQEEKANLRRDIRTTMQVMQQGEEEKLCARLLTLSLWQQPQRVLIYHPLSHEPNLLRLLEQKEHTFLFPKMHDQTLKLYQWAPGAVWRSGPYQVQEPDPTTWPLAEITDVDIALIPGMAFDSEGGRLGRGAGYFDRLLGSADCRALKIGIACSWQLVPKIPHEPHDVRMDFVVTPENIFQIARDILDDNT